MKCCDSSNDQGMLEAMDIGMLTVRNVIELVCGKE